MAIKPKKKITGKGLTRLISRDWLLRVLSLFLAIILWMFVGGENRIDKNVVVPVEIINLPQNLVISNQYKQEIKVSVSGPRSLIKEMSDDGAVRLINLHNANPGTLVVNNTNDDIRVPRGVVVKRIQPSSIILSLDKLVNKQLPIQSRTRGRVEQGFYLKSQETIPPNVNITGPQTALINIERLFTEPVNLTGMHNPVQLQVPLELSPKLVELIGETSVTVDLDIRPVAKDVTVKNLKVIAIAGGREVEVTPAEVTVVAAIPEEYLGKSFKPEELLTASAQGEPGKIDLPVHIQTKPGIPLPIYIESVTPSVVRLVNKASNTGNRDRASQDENSTEDKVESHVSKILDRIPFLEGKKKKRVTEEQ